MDTTEIRKFRSLYQDCIALGTDYVEPKRIIQLINALIDDLESDDSLPKSMNTPNSNTIGYLQGSLNQGICPVCGRCNTCGRMGSIYPPQLSIWTTVTNTTNPIPDGSIGFEKDK